MVISLVYDAPAGRVRVIAVAQATELLRKVWTS